MRRLQFGAARARAVKALLVTSALAQGQFIFFVRRMMGRPPEAGAARSRLGHGREGEELRR